MIRRPFAFAPLAGATLLVGLSLPACSSSPVAESGPSVATASQAIQGGTPDSTNQYRFNVGICMGGRGNCRSVCSGTLVTPNLVITARHCVDAAPDQIDCTGAGFGGQQFSTSQIFVTTHNQMEGQSTIGWHSVRQILRPPVNNSCGADIAMLVLNDQATEGQLAVPAVQSAVWDRSRYGATMQAIGYGVTSFGANDSGRRRYRPNIPILCIPGSPNDGYAESCPKTFPENEFVGGDGVCPGDSGSGAMDQASLTTGTPIALGVVVRTSDNGGNCEGSAITRLDKWRDFIVQSAQSASSNWTLYPQPSWTALVAPPPLPPAPTTEGSKKLGESCKRLVDCDTRLCKNRPDDGEPVCTVSCSAAKACPSGYECSADKFCFTPTPSTPTPPASSGSTPPPAAAPPAAEAPVTTTTTTTSGCAVAPDPTKPVPWRGLALCGVIVGLALGRRRRTHG